MKFRKLLFAVSIICMILNYGCTNKKVNSVDAFNINYNTITDEEDNNGTKILYQEIKYPKVEFKDGYGNKELTNYLNTLNEEFETSAKNFLNENKEYSREIFREIEYIGGNFEHDEEITIERFDDKVLSITSNCYEYTMGAHGLTTIIGYNYDVKNNKKIIFNDIIKDKIKLKEAMVNYLDNEFKEELDSNYKETIDSFLNGEYETRFLVTDKGLDIIFNQYDIAAYAVGIITVPIDYNGNEDIFSETFKKFFK